MSETKSEAYDRLFAEGQAVLNKYNPCKWENGKCAGLPDGCCGGCEHLTPTGCAVNALGCKLWLCGTIQDSTKEGLMAGKLLYILKQEAFELRVPTGVRSSKEQCFKFGPHKPNDPCAK